MKARNTAKARFVPNAASPVLLDVAVLKYDCCVDEGMSHERAVDFVAQEVINRKMKRGFGDARGKLTNAIEARTAQTGQVVGL